jgi:hypothetical protein
VIAKFDPRAFLENEKRWPTPAKAAKAAKAEKCPDGNNQDENNPRATLATLAGLAALPPRDCIFAEALAAVARRCPAHIEIDDWHRAVEDGRRFLTKWGADAERYGWTAEDIFGLPPIPEKPAPNYRRLSRYDLTGLVWLLRGRRIVSISATEAVMATPSGGQLTFYRSAGGSR